MFRSWGEKKIGWYIYDLLTDLLYLLWPMFSNTLPSLPLSPAAKRDWKSFIITSQSSFSNGAGIIGVHFINN